MHKSILQSEYVFFQNFDQVAIHINDKNRRITYIQTFKQCFELIKNSNITIFAFSIDESEVDVKRRFNENVIDDV